MTLSFVFLFTSSGEIPILYLQPELKKNYPFRGGEPARKANIEIGPSWVISSLCNSLEPGSLVGKKAKNGVKQPKKKAVDWEFFFSPFLPHCEAWSQAILT